ncbi:tubulin-specific chaperone A-like [Ylistrum balloti]|uniref:tubulin-specific chaperone A-like n=1 Tax=Ylistrum balloti TaxID=509963 RepID=UPI002905E80B|nr:tubulin-specific chaperone A-like [Ylistrum balloti]
MADPTMKQLKIQTGVVKRITKERYAYEKEAEMIEKKVEKMKAEGKDEYDIRKQEEVLEESRSMMPDTKRRLKKGIDSLIDCMKKFEQEQTTEEYKTAEEVLDEAKKAME